MKKHLFNTTLLFLIFATLNGCGQSNRCKTLYEAEDYKTAFEICQKAAEQGNTEAQTNLGTMYANGNGVIQNSQEAVTWYTKAVEQGYARAQYNLGVMYHNGEGVIQNHQEAIKWYKKAAEQGYASAQTNLGTKYYYGEGVKQNYKEAITWYKKAAEQDHVKAQYNLGLMYKKGEGVKQNYKEAITWYNKAAKQGDASAQLNLGKIYENGRGVTQNYKKAVTWYKKAAEQGNASAQLNLGVMYSKGKGVIQNHPEAVKWWGKAAKQGYVEVQLILGLIYEKGIGITQNYQEAYIWYAIAAANGHEEAREARDRAARYLSSTALSAAQQKAQQRMETIQSQQKVSPTPPNEDNTTPLQPTKPPDIATNYAAQAFENSWRSIVVIEAGTSQGSGVIIRPNVVATNCHVVEDASDIVVYKGKDKKANKSRVYEATIKEAYTEKDLCLLEVVSLWGVAINLRESKTLNIGEEVYAIGAPEGLDYSLSGGIISQLRQIDPDEAPLIQTDVAVSSGSSGGALVDIRGNLIGITTFKISDAEGLAFAIPIDWILDIR